MAKNLENADRLVPDYITKFITQAAFAKQCGVSRQAVGKAIAEGRVIITTRGLDPENPSNEYFKQKAQVRKTILRRPKTKKKKAQANPVPVVAGAPPETPEEFSTAERGPRPKIKAGAPATFDMYQKAYEETRLKKVQADLAVLKYAENVGAVVDIETLKQKMGAFSNFLFTHLVYLPENIAADLWMSARSDEDPERKIREMLSERIKNVIQEAQVAAAEVLPPDEGVRYIMLGLDEDE